MQANTRVAALESENKRLKHLLEEAYKNNLRRKRVKLDQNKRFAGVDNIIVNDGQSEAQ